MGSLECPLCCRESFPDKWSLKCHLLFNTTISCPACHQGFSTIIDLANHLDDSCGNDHVPASSGDSENTSKVLAHHGKPTEDSNVTSSVERSSTSVDGRLEQAGVPADKSLNYEVVESTSVVASGDMDEIRLWEQENEATGFNYVCLTCDCRIQGVTDHVARFHPNELEVVLQTADVVTVIPDTTVYDGGTVEAIENPGLAPYFETEHGNIPSDDTLSKTNLPIGHSHLMETTTTTNTAETVESILSSETVASHLVPDCEYVSSVDEPTNNDYPPIFLNNVVRKSTTTNTVATVQDSKCRKPLASCLDVEGEDTLRDEATDKDASPVLLNNVVRRSTSNTLETTRNSKRQKPLESKLSLEVKDEANNKNNSPILLNKLVRKRSITNMVNIDQIIHEKPLPSTLMAEHEDIPRDEGDEATNKNNSPIILNNVVKRRLVTNILNTVGSVPPSQPIASTLEAESRVTSNEDAGSKNSSAILLTNCLSNVTTAHIVEGAESATTSTANWKDLAADWDDTPEESTTLDEDVESNRSATSIDKTLKTKRVQVQTFLRDNDNLKSTPTTPPGKLVPLKSHSSPDSRVISKLVQRLISATDDVDSSNAKELKVCDVLEQRHIVDKSGIRYVRKVVKIDKFWENIPPAKSVSNVNKPRGNVPKTGGNDATNLIKFSIDVVSSTKVNKRSTTPDTHSHNVVKRVTGNNGGTTPSTKVIKPSATLDTLEHGVIKRVDENNGRVTPTTIDHPDTGGEDVLNTAGNNYNKTPVTVITRKILKNPKEKKTAEVVDHSPQTPSLITALRQLSKSGSLISIQAASTIILSPTRRPAPKPTPKLTQKPTLKFTLKPPPKPTPKPKRALYKMLGASTDANEPDNTLVNSAEELPTKCAVKKATAKPRNQKMTLAKLQKKMKCARKALFKVSADGSPVMDGRDPVLVCSSCKAEFRNQTRFSDHHCLPDVGGKMPASRCATCGTECMTDGDLNIHHGVHGQDPVKIDTAKRRERRCETCGLVSYSPVTFRVHYNAHVREGRADTTPTLGVLACNKCTLVFPDNVQLQRHLRLHPGGGGAGEKEVTLEFSPGDGDTFTCETCGKVLPEGGRGAHALMHQGQQNRHCGVCNKPFRLEQDLALHMVVHNKPGAGLACFYCKLRFENVFLLRSHVTETHTVFDRPYSCSFCGRRFYKALEKRRHERTHTGERNHKCEVCGAKFINVLCLKMHTLIHTGVRPYQCAHCGKSFRTLSGVKHHEEIHGTGRPYACPFCPKVFRGKGHLLNHKKQHDKPFMCSCCGRRFSDLFTLRAHMKAHSEGTLEHVCYLCGASYGRQYALAQHLKIHPTHDPQSSQVGGKTSSKRKRKRKKTVESSSDDDSDLTDRLKHFA